VHCISCIENPGNFAHLNKTYQSDWSFTWVDGIEVALQLERDKLQYDLFLKSLFWVVIVTTTKRELSEVKLKCLTHHFRTKYLFTPRSSWYSLNSTSFMLKKSTQVLFLNHDLFYILMS
jgi:hypothetical protein